MVSQKKEPIAIYAVADDPTDGNMVRVPLFRTASSPAGKAIASHISRRLILHTLGRERRITAVTDDSMSEASNLALSDMGFFETVSGWSKISLPIVGATNEVAEALRQFRGSMTDEVEGLTEWADLVVQQGASMDEEHNLWPLKVLDLEVPGYIIPIEAQWATELFDEGLAAGRLFGRDTSLGINTEAVYYRTCRGSTINAPGHLLWYVSDSGADPGTKAIRACSRLDEVIVGKPKELFRRFRPLGIYQWEDVYATAGRNVEQPIMAIRFSGTELFRRPIPYAALRAELESVGANPTMVGPIRIPPPLFLKLYGSAVR